MQACFLQETLNCPLYFIFVANMQQTTFTVDGNDIEMKQVWCLDGMPLPIEHLDDRLNSPIIAD